MRMKCKVLLVGVMSLLASMTTSVTAAVPIRQVQIVAEDMCCQGCARKVSGQLYAARGVKEVGVDMTTHTVTVSLPESKAATLGQLWHAVERGDGERHTRLFDLTMNPARSKRCVWHRHSPLPSTICTVRAAPEKSPRSSTPSRA